MQPNRLGRVLGIGTRIAAQKIRERTAQAGQAPSPNVPIPTRAAAEVGATASSAARPAPVPSARIAATRTGAAVAGGGRRLARGAGRFGSAMFRPFAHASGVLALQISGVFFALFGVFFLSHAWQMQRAAGWHDRHTQVYAALALVFGYFTLSSFWRAKRKERGR